jgi:hypothetical protein
MLRRSCNSDIVGLVSRSPALLILLLLPPTRHLLLLFPSHVPILPARIFPRQVPNTNILALNSNDSLTPRTTTLMAGTVLLAPLPHVNPNRCCIGLENNLRKLPGISNPQSRIDPSTLSCLGG